MSTAITSSSPQLGATSIVEATFAPQSVGHADLADPAVRVGRVAGAWLSPIPRRHCAGLDPLAMTRTRQRFFGAFFFVRTTLAVLFIGQQSRNTQVQVGTGRG
jgi:hypothetical protein